LPSNVQGYLTPTDTILYGQALEDFLLDPIYAWSELASKDLLRVAYQIDEPIRPRIDPNDSSLTPPKIDWLAYTVEVRAPADAMNREENMSPDGLTQTQSAAEEIIITLNFYGPNAQGRAMSFQSMVYLPQNQEFLKPQKLGVQGFTDPRRIPDLVNDQWYNRYIMTLTLTRAVQRTYEVLSFLASEGTIVGRNGSTEIRRDFDSNNQAP